ncbi:hypothetical protein KEJ33_04535 [Candidatus Bathyarchaeota archaeon]|nr:hypothetical protein [Candidatus Bathyarchaeota archaeon]
MKKWFAENAQKIGSSASMLAPEFDDPKGYSQTEIERNLKDSFSLNDRLFDNLEAVERSDERFSVDQTSLDTSSKATCTKNSFYSSRPYRRQKTLQIICGNEGTKLTRETLFELSRSKVRLIP